jgi:syndecan 3
MYPSILSQTAIGLGVAFGLLLAIFLVIVLLYRIRRKDEGRYTLDEPKRITANYSRGGGHGIYS